VTEPVLVVSVGIVTAVGLTAAETAASARAGTMRFEASPFYDRKAVPFTLAQVPDDGLPDLADAVRAVPGLTAREGRMLRLASPALRECVAPLAGRSPRPALPLCLALPETETTRALDRAAFLLHLGAQVPGVVDPQRSDGSHAGRAGGLRALGQAAAAIQDGQAELVLAGGIDTYRDAYVLAALDAERRVKSMANMDGFIPGEGAAFLLLASPAAVAARGLVPLARLAPGAAGFEGGHLYSTEPYRGDGLAAAFAQLAGSGAIDAPIAEVYSSMNGESHWAKEWGVGFLRNRAAFRPDHGMHHPADSFGDTGAACGPILVGLAALGVKAGYRRAPALVYSSSDHGLRAATVVSAVPH
jgi:3-oxoacyl-[acyl-carrier-protein] synthase I